MISTNFYTTVTEDKSTLSQRLIKERQIKNKLILVRSFIDERKSELQGDASSHTVKVEAILRSDSSNVMEKARALRLIDMAWGEWNDQTEAKLCDPSTDLELFKCRVHEEMNNFLDQLEHFEV